MTGAREPCFFLLQKGATPWLPTRLGRYWSSTTHLLQLALGGTAVGTGVNSHREFKRLAIAAIARETGFAFVPASNAFAALAGHDAAVRASSALKQLATA